MLRSVTNCRPSPQLGLHSQVGMVVEVEVEVEVDEEVEVEVVVVVAAELLKAVQP